jgi:orotidine-5'-phosphate decarboxylase
MLQDLKTVCTDNRAIYHHVAQYVQNLTKNNDKCVGAVIGATYPEQLAELRRWMPDAWFLIPGYGTQGGTAEDITWAFDGNGFRHMGEGYGALINNSRGIIFAHTTERYKHYGEANWERAVEMATINMINELREFTSAGKLL